MPAPSLRRPAALLCLVLLPVLVWFHGGGFCGGAGSLAWHNGTSLARRGLLVVTLNYRLGPLGFLASLELARQYGADGGLNGARDVITALRWVRPRSVHTAATRRTGISLGEVGS